MLEFLEETLILNKFPMLKSMFLISEDLLWERRHNRCVPMYLCSFFQLFTYLTEGLQDRVEVLVWC